MATFTAIIARTGHLEEIKVRLGSPFYSIKEADTEAEAITLAAEKFEQDSIFTDTTPNLEDVDAYEMFGSDNETVIGWEVDTMGMSRDSYFGFPEN